MQTEKCELWDTPAFRMCGIKMDATKAAKRQ